jgi:predicted RNase H-like nuclease
VPRLLAAGVQLPGLGEPDLETTSPARIALEGYPGLLARELLQQASASAGLNLKNRSYKNDNKALQTPERLIARKDMLTALEHGQTRLGLRLKLTHAQRDRLVDDATGDSLDAVLCLVQAAWAQQQHESGQPRYGLPATVDPLEGWIITA